MPTLNWIGKDKVINHHTEVPYHTLTKIYDYGFTNEDLGFTEIETENRKPENMIIHGDNLLALKSLLPLYENRIKCIYIDPPYNTGNENWVYNDNVNSPELQKWLGKTVGKDAEDLTRHDKWLCMMYPRLVLLRKLLSQDGVIFISIDDNEQANLKLICDEIFGSANFVANIIWQKKYSPQNDAKWFSDNHDHILVYSKNKEIWKPNLLPRTEEMNNRYQNPDNDSRGVWKTSDLSAKRVTEKDIYEIVTPSGKVVFPPKGRSWSVSKEKFKLLLEDNRIWFGKDNNSVPQLKRFLTDVQQGTVPLTIWLYDEVGHNQTARQEIKSLFFDSENPFETPKPSKLIEKILRLSTDKDSIILDSFAGSGTTAHAVLNLNAQDGGNRQFILIEMENYAENITAERVKRVIAQNQYEAGFGFYGLGEVLLTDEHLLNENAKIEAIRAYIWYSETGESFTEAATENKNAYFLGNYQGRSYYFYYEPEKISRLDYDFLATITQPSESYLIYADVCNLDSEFLEKHNIIFKKIPRDISRI